jgi:hypothetical protein
MKMFEISLRVPDPNEPGVQRLRVTEDYLRREPSLSAAHKAAIAALAPGEVWTGLVIEVLRLDDKLAH